MSYTLTPEQLASISDAEHAFGTTRLLPPYEDIPDDFKVESMNTADMNVYVDLVLSLFYSGKPNSDAEMRFRSGFDALDTPRQLARCVRAHLCSFEPKHEHKIAGVAYMISLVCEIQRVDAPAPATV